MKEGRQNGRKRKEKRKKGRGERKERTYVCTCVYMYVHIHVYTHVHTCTCLYINIYIYIYILYFFLSSPPLSLLTRRLTSRDPSFIATVPRMACVAVVNTRNPRGIARGVQGHLLLALLVSLHFPGTLSNGK